ncbi:transposase family protein [Nonomuraea turcica]|uniref:transposase family protein n=1 Tax=Nonomuraea sp. G32 TaxID=3067274 RepID=UPI00273CBAF5|nr:transposase family protein [Nonomuraea sp. G32]MDP4511534.1 transposase family protein [Nonomuraea sp. G32]
MIPYRAILDVPRELVSHLSRLLRAERRLRGTRKGTRKSSPWWQAVYGLVWFRNGGDIANLGRGFGLSRTTSYRYLNEVIDVLAEQAPDLKDALDRARADGRPHLILDGTLTSIDRVGEKKTSVKGKEIDAWYSGKVRAFAANLQGLMTPGGFPIWISDALPGSTHDITAAREQVLATIRPYLKDMPVLADSGYEGAGAGVHVPVKQPADGRELDVDTRTRNALLRSLRCLGERGFALLEQRWRTLQHVHLSPSRVGELAKAALVLTHFEHGMIR